jgi:hypothetical protein
MCCSQTNIATEIDGKRAELAKLKLGLTVCMRKVTSASGETQEKYVKAIRIAEDDIAALERWFELSRIDMVDPAIKAKAEANQKKEVDALRAKASEKLAEATRLFDEAAALEKTDPMLAYGK